MNLAWPLSLVGLLVVPVLVALYVWRLRRARRDAVVFSDVTLVRAALHRRRRWRRHLPAALLLAGLSSMTVAAARPQASVLVPFGRTTIMLALDVSLSMCATDVSPNRFSVAIESAKRFVADQPKGTRIGLVVFAGFAEVAVPPTEDRDRLITAIDGLTTARGTAIGAAILKSIEAIAAENPDVAPIADTELDDVFNGESQEIDSRRPGGYVPDIVVLLTDGANTRGIPPLDMIHLAVARGIRVYTIGFGTENPTELACTIDQLGSDVFGDGRFGGGFDPGGGADPGGGGVAARRQFLVIDEPTLRAVAERTGGAFYKAEDADQLTGVFRDLPREVELARRDQEISVFFALAGGILLAAALLVGAWMARPGPTRTPARPG